MALCEYCNLKETCQQNFDYKCKVMDDFLTENHYDKDFIYRWFEKKVI